VGGPVPMHEPFRDELNQLRARSPLRRLREIASPQGPSVDLVGEHLVNFASNDYLGLAADERLRRAAKSAIDEFGVGAGASRLISGTQSPHVQLESAIAKWKRAPAAIAFSSGYAAAVGTLSSIASKNDVIILDKLAHASLIDGARLSGATLRVFPHNHLGKLESHLEWAQRELPQARIVVVTESIFSMDGDRAPLHEIAHLKSRFNALLFVDEAHAVGVIGEHGTGAASEPESSPQITPAHPLSLKEKIRTRVAGHAKDERQMKVVEVSSKSLGQSIDIQMGTLSKALGCSGGYICGSATLIEWLINRARSFIYSTAPPAAIAAAATAAIGFLQTPEGEERRRTLWKNIRLLHELLAPGKAPASAIFPLIIGDEQQTLDLAQALRKEGFFVPAIRYPTVARGAARLRITVTAAHTEAQVRDLAAQIQRLRPDLTIGTLNPAAENGPGSGQAF
jgi:7-keto-8-aminopelargonate synthetase-like enzyme